MNLFICEMKGRANSETKKETCRDNERDRWQ